VQLSLWKKFHVCIFAIQGEDGMKFTVQYIPLGDIKKPESLTITDGLKRLERLMWDCMNILVVRKNRDGYTILSGHDRLDYLKEHTKNFYAPCIVDDSDGAGIKSWMNRLINKKPLDDFPMTPKSWSIFRSFLKKEPRFRKLSRVQQIRVMIMAIRYKRTTITSMKNVVNQMIRSNHSE
jgi:hypothetical protein